MTLFSTQKIKLLQDPREVFQKLSFFQNQKIGWTIVLQQFNFLFLKMEEFLGNIWDFLKSNLLKL